MPPSIFPESFTAASEEVEIRTDKIQDFLLLLTNNIAEALNMRTGEERYPFEIESLGTLSIQVQEVGYNRPEKSVVLKIKGYQEGVYQPYTNYYILSQDQPTGDLELYPVSSGSDPRLEKGINLTTHEKCKNMRYKHERIKVPSFGSEGATAEYSIDGTKILSTFNSIGSEKLDERIAAVGATELLLSLYTHGMLVD